LHVHLTPKDRLHLDSLIKKGICSARVQNRARILLLADRGTSGDGKERTRQQIRDATLTCLPTVCRICRRYAAEGLQAALSEKPRPGKAPKLSGAAEAHLVATACSKPPDGQVRWTLKLLRQKLVAEGHVQDISEVALHKRLKKMRSSPGK
jgi:hypothetical protein